MKKILIYTIGHSTRTVEEFVSVLRSFDIEKVVDIRTIPKSRHNPQFNLDIMPVSLRGRRIGYIHMKGLGGLRRSVKDSVNTGWKNSSFRGFADYMQTVEFEGSLENLIELAREKRVAIMCAEAVPWRCHRSLVSDALTVRGAEVVHILGPASSRVHALTSFAKVRGKKITYPAEQNRLSF